MFKENIMNKGRVYIVATPIGNLGDMTYRAVEILKSVPFVLAEDTRESKKLFNRYDIPTQLISYRDQNHGRMISKIIEKLDIGLNLALISDSGTPLISDPGFKLVKELRELGYIVESIPGPSALIAALSISGLPTDKFAFLGFLPKSDSRRKDILKEYLNLGCTVVVYESPKRVIDLLSIIGDCIKENTVVLAKDLTKLREEVLTGEAIDLISLLKGREFDTHPHGEFVVMISPFSQKV
ncbi:16S rRNA (cytidine(1402)-2'-O)-methyltransferase [candidate division WS6 bacterium RIFOXYC1_FULL_33_9]|nr:MAG: 16S rRNA (cytidine(1402)-2'-O)-methyltransferase [candidate division WS6 bacterium RIFOXYC1_FULL_33_9]